MLRACDQRAGAILNHMATADVARDMDLLRAALGDARLNYVGYSYGSYLGVTYANLFPDRFRALVVDGVLDPVAWSTGAGNSARTQPVSTRLRSDAGTLATLEEFFRLCDAAGPSGCAFAPRSKARYADLADRLKDDPTPIKDPFTGEVFLYNYSFLVADTIGAMYFSPDWPFFAELLAYVDANVDPDGAGAALASFRHQLGVTDPTFDRYQNQIEGFPGVLCSDSDNPDNYDAWSTAGKAADQQFRYFGRAWTWVSSLCAEWRGQDAARYMGPFTATTQAPVLVVGTKFDPATRYEGARTVAGLLPELPAPDRAGVGAHLGRALGVRRRGGDAVRGRRSAPAGRHRLPAELQAVHQPGRGGSRGGEYRLGRGGQGAARHQPSTGRAGGIGLGVPTSPPWATASGTR